MLWGVKKAKNHRVSFGKSRLARAPSSFLSARILDKGNVWN